MTSDRRLTANRANAQRSTGPRSRAGKSKSSQNARRHGLNVPVADDPALASDIARWEKAFQIAAAGDPAVIRAAAEQQVHLLRIRAVRRNTLALAAAQVTDSVNPAELAEATLDELARLDGYERKALSRRNRLLRRLTD